MSQDKIVARTMLHSCYIHDTGTGKDGIVISEIIENEKGETKPNLRVFKAPVVSVWATQPMYRNHTDKKEFENVKLLDELKVPFKDKDMELFKYMNNGYTPSFMSPKMRREIAQSPYVYGANIALEARIAISYKKALAKANKTPHTPTTGFFDIEKSLIPSSFGRLPLMVFTAENKVYLTMMRSFMNEKLGNGRKEVTIADVEKAARDFIDPLVASIFAENDDLKDSRKKLPFEYHFHIGDTEVDMIRWIFGKMHESKTSFIGVWNIGFDIPEIIAVLRKNNIPLEEIFSDPSLLGTGFEHADWREDKRQVAHFSQKWHWLSATAHFQFVDSMSLFSHIRIVDGKQASYALDDILKIFGLGGKLKIDTEEDLSHLQTEDWHREMLGNYFAYYAAYAMWDAMALQILEWLNTDLTAMMVLCDITSPRYYVNQTIRVTNTLFEEWLAKGHVLGTGVDVEGLRDEELVDGGGAVLEPQNLVARGLRLFKEFPNLATHCYAWLNDLDFSAQYPSNIFALNISKQTKLATMVHIKAPWVENKYTSKEAIEVFCSYLITPSSNGVEMGTEFFNLPDYAEMSEMFKERLLETT